MTTHEEFAHPDPTKASRARYGYASAAPTLRLPTLEHLSQAPLVPTAWERVAGTMQRTRARQLGTVTATEHTSPPWQLATCSVSANSNIMSCTLPERCMLLRVGFPVQSCRTSQFCIMVAGVAKTAEIVSVRVLDCTGAGSVSRTLAGSALPYTSCYQCSQGLMHFIKG